MRLFKKIQRYPLNKFLVHSCACLILCFALCPVLLADAGTVLREGWKVQSSAKITGSPEQISATGFSTEGWYSTSAPKTVFAVLVENGVYKDPYFGMNLRSVPGVSYKVGGQFANDEVPDDSPYAVPWWYRKEFTVPASDKGKRIWLAGQPGILRGAAIDVRLDLLQVHPLDRDLQTLSLGFGIHCRAHAATVNHQPRAAIEDHPNLPQAWKLRINWHIHATGFEDRQQRNEYGWAAMLAEAHTNFRRNPQLA